MQNSVKAAIAILLTAFSVYAVEDVRYLEQMLDSDRRLNEQRYQSSQLAIEKAEKASERQFHQAMALTGALFAILAWTQHRQNSQKSKH